MDEELFKDQKKEYIEKGAAYFRDEEESHIGSTSVRITQQN